MHHLRCGNAPDKHPHSCQALHFVFSQVHLLQLINYLTTVGYLLEVFLDYGYLLWSVFHFCLELALETLAKTSLTHFLWVHDPLISELYSF